MKMHTNLWRKD